ncbi:MAG: TIM barrel protein [Bacteroidota bacterium]|nr:TIM barrel protein [Bacteroidota bacterium]
MKLGISTYTFTWAIGVPGHIPAHPLTAFQLVEKAAKYDVDCVQIADNLPLDTFTNDDLILLKNHADKENINIEVGMRGLKIPKVLQYLEIARLFNSSFLRIVIDENEFHPSLEEIISLLKELMPSFENHNIVLAIENHDRFLAAEFKYIIESVGSKYLGICLDSVNSMGAGEGFREVSETLLPFTVNLHLKDFNITRVSHMMGFDILGAPAGQGMINVNEIIARASSNGKCVSAILELWTPFVNSIEETIALEQKWADESISFLKKLINKS